MLQLFNSRRQLFDDNCYGRLIHNFQVKTRITFKHVKLYRLLFTGNCLLILWKFFLLPSLSDGVFVCWVPRFGYPGHRSLLHFQSRCLLCKDDIFPGGIVHRCRSADSANASLATRLQKCAVSKNCLQISIGDCN